MVVRVRSRPFRSSGRCKIERCHPRPHRGTSFPSARATTKTLRAWRSPGLLNATARAGAMPSSTCSTTRPHAAPGHHHARRAGAGEGTVARVRGRRTTPLRRAETAGGVLPVPVGRARHLEMNSPDGQWPCKRPGALGPGASAAAARDRVLRARTPRRIQAAGGRRQAAGRRSHYRASSVRTTSSRQRPPRRRRPLGPAAQRVPGVPRAWTSWPEV